VEEVNPNLVNPQAEYFDVEGEEQEDPRDEILDVNYLLAPNRNLLVNNLAHL